MAKSLIGLIVVPKLTRVKLLVKLSRLACAISVIAERKGIPW